MNPHSPLGKLPDVCNYSKCSFDPGALESNLTVMFYIQGMVMLVHISLEQKTHESGTEFRAAMIPREWVATHSHLGPEAKIMSCMQVLKVWAANRWIIL